MRKLIKFLKQLTLKNDFRTILVLSSATVFYSWIIYAMIDKPITRIIVTGSLLAFCGIFLFGMLFYQEYSKWDRIQKFYDTGEIEHLNLLDIDNNIKDYLTDPYKLKELQEDRKLEQMKEHRNEQINKILRK